MKKNYIFFVVMLLTMSTFSQSVRVVLKSRVEMINLPYDSIQITNLRTGFKWMKLYPDTVLFSFTVGIDDQQINFPDFGFEPGFPNPVDGSTIVSLNTTESGSVILSLFDILGNLCSQKSIISEPGIYSFNIAPPQKGIYILEAKSAKQKSTIKLIQMGTGTLLHSIELVNTTPNQTMAKPAQTKDDSNYFVIGDSLSFTCWKNGNTKSGAEKIDHNGYIFFNIFPETTGDFNIIDTWRTLPGDFPMEPVITTITTTPYQNLVSFVNDSILQTYRLLSATNSESGWYYSDQGHTTTWVYSKSNSFIRVLLVPEFFMSDIFYMNLITNNFFILTYDGFTSRDGNFPQEGSSDYFIRFP
ncbi:MAG: hypothetical protein H6Q25_1155 [Bacteroidetes bacterium]|nr:hypothetical protein [Bacteroidota bacterium]